MGEGVVRVVRECGGNASAGILIRVFISIVIYRH